MRIHRLVIEAFGPYAERQEVDFDALTSQGLFLLHGPTGAGKTTVLDAICFALYGRVPGVRTQQRLHSDHAPADREPRVLCDLTVRGRRFEVTRSPAWDRPKRRGAGAGVATTKVGARVAVREYASGQWVERSTRADEAGQLLGDVLGLTAEEFTRVVLLPQGEFAAFLRADATDRQALLQHLFATERFEQVQAWLSDHALRAEASAARLEDEARLAALRAEQSAAAAGLRAPEGTETDPVGGVLGLRGLALTALADLAAPLRSAADRLDEARARAEQARARRDRHARLEEVDRARHDLDRDAEAQRLRLDRLRRHELARPALWALDQADEAEQARRRAAEHCAEAAGGLRAAGATCASAPAEHAATAELEATRAELTRLELLGPRLDRLAELTGQQTELTDRLGGLDVEIAELTAAEKSLQAGLDAAAGRRAELDGQVTAVPLLRVRLDAARARLEAQHGYRRLTGELERSRAESLDLTARWQDARQESLDLRQRRLDNMAAELAGGLADGRPCPVCGSPDHPVPALGTDAALVTPADEEAARTRAEESGRLAEAAQLACARLVARCTALREDGADADPAATAEEIAGLGRDLDAAEEAARELARIEAEEARATERLAGARRRLDTARLAHARTATSLDQVTGERADTARTLELAYGDDPDLPSRIARLTRLREALTAWLEAHRALVAAEARAGGTAGEAAQKVAAAGFPDAAEARAARLDETTERRLAARRDDYAARESAHHALAALPEVVRAAREREEGLPVPGEPEADALRHRADLVQAECDRLRATEAVVRRAAETLDACRDQMAALATRIGRARDHAALLRELADTCRGLGGENTLRMSLTAFVLAARLEQVAAAATERLSAMSTGRYELRHDDSLAAHGARSGLGLVVVDHWTGLPRDTRTLSGGETFLASLSLALGLADVVQREAGGVDMGTLFVDEGFGSLDAEALDEVMATLDGLRSGGRAVGIVSHVADLRSRVPARLEVVKGRHGSRLVGHGTAEP